MMTWNSSSTEEFRATDWHDRVFRNSVASHRSLGDRLNFGPQYAREGIIHSRIPCLVAIKCCLLGAKIRDITDSIK